VHRHTYEMTPAANCADIIEVTASRMRIGESVPLQEFYDSNCAPVVEAARHGRLREGRD